MDGQVIPLRKYIGRSYEEYNCFDLVKEFYADHFGLDLREYWDGGPVPARGEVESLIVSSKGDFVEVKGSPKFGDLVVIRLYGIECHIGVVIEGGKFLHSARRIGSTLDRLERYSKMIAGYYRHQEHNDSPTT